MSNDNRLSVEDATDQLKGLICNTGRNLETDPEKILAANRKRHEKAMEFDELFRENSLVNIMSAQIHDLQKDRDRLYKRVQNLEKLIMDMVESRLDKAEAEVFGTPLDRNKNKATKEN